MSREIPKEKNIVFCSLQKPVNDVRMHDKLAKSISALQGYNIHLIGQNIFSENLTPTFTYHPIDIKNKKITGKLKSIVKISRIVFDLKPSIIICCTFELLFIAVVCRIIWQSKIVYDVRENYSLNIQYIGSKNHRLRLILSKLVYVYEHICSLFVNEFIVAEKCYLQQLSYLKGRKVSVLENKSIEFSTFQRKIDLKSTQLIYTGTIAREYGIFEVLEFTERWYAYNSNIKLLIIGHVTRRETYNELVNLIHSRPYIIWKGEELPVNHYQIVNELLDSDIALMPYQKNKSFEGKFPTKLFEYLALKKPIICQYNNSWSEIIHNKNAGILIDFKSECDFNKIEEMIKSIKYTNEIDQETVWSKDDQEKFSRIIANLLPT